MYFADKLLYMSRIHIGPWFVLLWVLSIMIFPAKFIIAWVIAVVIHEFGHYIALKILGIKIFHVSFHFGRINIHTEAMSPLQQIITAIAGPVAGALLSLISFDMELVHIFALIQTCCNLIPLYPTDGGRVVTGILKLLLKADTASKVHSAIETVTSWILLLAAVVVSASFHLGPWLLLGIIFFLLKIKLSCKQERQEIQ